MKHTLSTLTLFLFISFSFGHTQLGSDIDGETEGDYFAYNSMNSAGDRVAIGAWSNDGNVNNAGHVRVYDLVNGSWTQVGSDIDGEAEGDESGKSVSMNSDGSIVAIGAPSNDGSLPSRHQQKCPFLSLRIVGLNLTRPFHLK